LRVADDGPFHNPFGVLASLKGSLPERPDPDPPPVKAKPPSTARTVPRAVVRLERAGRGGKDVTIVEHLGIAPADRMVWLKALKAQLGCGGVVEDESLVLQGDHRKRLPALLTARGVKKVTIG
jgi:translation initiation factor 1